MPMRRGRSPTLERRDRSVSIASPLSPSPPPNQCSQADELRELLWKVEDLSKESKEHSRRHSEMHRKLEGFWPHAQDHLLQMAKSEAHRHSQGVTATLQMLVKHVEDLLSMLNIVQEGQEGVIKDFANVIRLFHVSQDQLRNQLSQIESSQSTMSRKHDSLQEQLGQLITAREVDASAIAYLQSESVATTSISSDIEQCRTQMHEEMTKLMSLQVAEWGCKHEALQETLKEHSRRHSEMHRKVEGFWPHAQDHLLQRAKSEAHRHSQDVTATLQMLVKQAENDLLSKLNIAQEEVRKDFANEIRLLHVSQDQLRNQLSQHAEDFEVCHIPETHVTEPIANSVANKFTVHRSDMENVDKFRVHQILVECPGVCEEDVDIRELPNGVGVSIAAGGSFFGLPVRAEFEQEFFLDRATDCIFELCFEECTLDKGILRLVLQGRPPPRLKLASRIFSIPQLQRVPDINPDVENITEGISLCDDALQVSPSQAWDLVGAEARLTPDEEPNFASKSRSSDCSNSIRCYLPNTAFRSSDGNLVFVQNLHVGSQVLLSNGDVASVADMRRYPKDDHKCNNLVEVSTRHASLKTSAKHRIVVASHDGIKTGTRLAQSLKVGEHIFVGDREQRITKIISSEERGELFMISFQPDGPVEAFLVPNMGVQTRGEPLLQNVSEADLLQVTPTAYED